MSGTCDQNHILAAVKKMIVEKSTMTLATARDNTAWAAPVYYSAHQNRFYFFSDPKSRHIQETLCSGQAACAIYEESRQWQEIKGIQMSGKIDPIEPGPEALNALKAYVKKFPLIHSLFADMNALNLNALYSRFSVRLYRYTPNIMIYMDNSIHFGFRQEIKL